LATVAAEKVLKEFVSCCDSEKFAAVNKRRNLNFPFSAINGGAIVGESVVVEVPVGELVVG